jgi:hypothetical protein
LQEFGKTWEIWEILPILENSGKLRGEGTLFRKPIGMAFNIQVLLKSSDIPEFRNKQQSGFT